jgi:hypothetical protein
MKEPVLLTVEQLQKLSTPRLLNYKKKHYPRPNPYMMDHYHDSCTCNSCQLIAKQNAEYMKTFNAIKEILATRENVEVKNG